MLQIFSGEDEHTAVDGPYTRLMKTRKWLYISSGAAALLSYDFINTPEVKNLTKIIDVSPYLLGASITGGLVYLLIQYSFLLIQLFSIYDIVLLERFKFRREDELTKARAKIDSTKRKLRELKLIVGEDQKLADLFSQERDLDKEYALTQFRATTHAITSQYGNHNEEEKRQAAQSLEDDQIKLHSITEERKKIWKLKDSRTAELDDEHNIGGATEELEEAKQSYDLLARQNPADRGVYRRSELMIDAARLIPAAILPSIALFGLVAHLPNLSRLNSAQQAAKSSLTATKRSPNAEHDKIHTPANARKL